MLFSPEAPREADRQPHHFRRDRLEELLSTPEPPEVVCVEWMLDYVRSNDCARP